MNGTKPLRITKFLIGHTYELAAEVLARPEVPADLVISRFFAKRKYLGSHDRGFIADTTYALLRDVLRLRRLLAPLIERAGEDFEPAILLAAHLIDRQPGIDRSVVIGGTDLTHDEIVQVTDELAEGKRRAEELPEPERLAIRVGLPEWFVARVTGQVGVEKGGELLDALNTQAPIALRANRLVTDRERLIEALTEQEVEAVPGRWSPDAVILRRRMNAYTVPEFKQGWFELQDEGSQFLSILIDPHPNWRVFDACAGAGGKTLHLAALMRGRGEVVAHDINERRLSEIRPRLKRSTAQNVRVMSHETYLAKGESLEGVYDAVMIDAPCSGTGVLRRNPGSRLVLSEEMIERLLPQQAEILDEYCRLVKPGGAMLYATCSVLREENEAQVEGFLARNPGWKVEPLPVDPSMATPEGYFRSYPHLHDTDAFFGAMFRRGVEGEG